MNFITSFRLFENVQKSIKILNELDIPSDNEDYLKLKELLKNNSGYLGKFTEWFFKDKISFSQLENLYSQLINHKLDKPIEKFKSPESVGDYITNKNADTKVNQVLKALPSRTRKLVNQELIDLIFNNFQYSSSIIDFYSKKGGRYKDINNLINDTTNLITNLSGGWDVNSIDYSADELVYRDGSTLILHISTYERSKKLGSSHWCISYSKDNWNGYTSDFNKQYFIYDFTKKISDKKSMIGVTVQLDGNIKASHYRDDTKCNKNELTIYSKYLSPYSEEYIESKVDVNNFETVIRYGLINHVKRLINQGQDPSVNDNYAIRHASYFGYLEIVKLLLQDKRVDPSDNDNFAIQWASENGHSEVVKLLLQDKRVDPSVNDNYALIRASENGHLEVVKLLLQDKRVDPSDNGNYAIRYASLNGYLEVVKLLLQDKRVDPSDKNNYAIQWASENGHLEVVKLLLQDKEVDPSTRNNYAIRRSSENGHLEVVKLLLQDKRVINSLSKDDLQKYKSKV